MASEAASRKQGYGTTSPKGKRDDAATQLGTHLHAWQIGRFFGVDVLKQVQKATRAGKVSERTETERRRAIYTGAQILQALAPEPQSKEALSKDIENAKLARARRQKIEGEVIPRDDVRNALADTFRELQNAFGHTKKGNEVLRKLRDLFQE